MSAPRPRAGLVSPSGPFYATLGLRAAGSQLPPPRVDSRRKTHGHVTR